MHREASKNSAALTLLQVPLTLVGYRGRILTEQNGIPASRWKRCSVCSNRAGWTPLRDGCPTPKCWWFSHRAWQEQELGGLCWQLPYTGNHLYPTLLTCFLSSLPKLYQKIRKNRAQFLISGWYCHKKASRALCGKPLWCKTASGLVNPTALMANAEFSGL